MAVWSRAPARIDLAGGTLDIWPLYLLMDYGLTVNVAVTVYSHVWLRPAEGGYRLVSEDAGLETASLSLNWFDLGGPLGLVARAVRHAAPAPGLSVVTRNEAPRGSGLGASSSLLVALLAALERHAGRTPASGTSSTSPPTSKPRPSASPPASRIITPPSTAGPTPSGSSLGATGWRASPSARSSPPG